MDGSNGNGRSTGEKFTRRSFLATTAAAGLAVGAAGQAAGATKYITFEHHFDERCEYYLEVSGSLGKSRKYNASISGSDEIKNGGSAVSGVVRGGRDTYSYTGEIVEIGANNPVDVEINGSPTDISELLDYTVTIEAPSSGRSSYELAVDGFFSQTAGYNATLNANDDIESYVAKGQVGSGGRDSYSTSGQVESLDVSNSSANVYLNGDRVDASDLPSLTSGDGGDDLKNGYDSRERSWNRGETFENFEDFSRGWYPTSGRLESGEPFDGGVGSAKISNPNGANRIGMALDFDGGADFSDVDFSYAVKILSPDHESLSVHLEADTRDDRVRTSRYLSSDNGWHRIDIGSDLVKGNPDLSNVERLRFTAYVGDKNVEILVDEIKTAPKRENGAVIFTFDDGHESVYNKVMPLFNDYGFGGATAVIPRIVGDSGRMSEDQLDAVLGAGFDVVAHPQRPSVDEGLGDLSKSEAEAEIRDSKSWLNENGYSSSSNILVWPFGDFDHDALELAGEYFDLAFGGGSSTANGIVTEAAWVPRVKANDASDMDGALRALDNAAEFNQVAVMQIHAVGTSGGLAVSDLRRLCDRAEANNLDVITPTEFAAEQP